MIQAGYKYETYSDYTVNKAEISHNFKSTVNKASILRAKKKKMLFKGIVVFFAYALVLVYLCVKSATLGYQIVNLEKDIHAVETENLRIKYLTENSCSLETVEKIAINELKMTKPDGRIDVALLSPEIKSVTPEKVESNRVEARENQPREKPLHKLYANMAFLATKNR